MKIRNNFIFVWQKSKQSGQISFKLWINKITTAKPEITPVGNWIYFPILKLSVFIFRLSVVRIFPAEHNWKWLPCRVFLFLPTSAQYTLFSRLVTQLQILALLMNSFFLFPPKKNDKKNEKTCFSLNWLTKGNKFLETPRVHAHFQIGPDLGEWGRV